MMKRIGTLRNSTPNQAAAVRPNPALVRPASTWVRSERIEGSEPLHDGEVDRHDYDRHHGERGCQRQVAGGALVLIDELADEGPRRADQIRDDVIAQGEREGED